MIRLSNRLPKQLAIACSGGSDSMALLDFLRQKHDVVVAFFDHGTEHSKEAKDFLIGYCEKIGVEIVIGKISGERPKNQSCEEFWRNERYGFLHSLDMPVVTGHNLDDCIETWLWSSLHGESKLIPYAYHNVIRPALMTSKNDLREWCVHREVPWIEDPSNQDVKYMRNLIRHDLMPTVLKLNPGIAKVIRKKLLERIKK